MQNGPPFPNIDAHQVRSMLLCVGVGMDMRFCAHLYDAVFLDVYVRVCM